MASGHVCATVGGTGDSGDSSALWILPRVHAQPHRADRTLGHSVLGRTRGAKVLSFCERRWRGLAAWWALGNCALIATAFLNASSESAHSHAAHGYWLQLVVVLACNVPFYGCFWLSLDRFILRRLIFHPVPLWINGNILVFGLMQCLLQRWDLVFAVSTFVNSLGMFIIPFADCFPESQRRVLSRAGYAIGVLITVGFSLITTKFTDPTGPLATVERVEYDPVLLSVGIHRVTATSVFLSASSNLVFFQLGLLAAAIRRPQSYAVWRSNLVVTRRDPEKQGAPAPGSIRGVNPMVAAAKRGAAQVPNPMEAEPASGEERL